MKTRILFVDEEANILDGIRRSLRDMREEWDMAFVLGGQEALERLAQESFDVVVSGLTMPGMDDRHFLGKIRQDHPGILRIVLSSHSDKKSIAHLAGTAHQYLAKPCDTHMLKSAIARSKSLREVVEDRSIKQIISQIESLPSLPSLYFELMQELQSENASMQRIGDIIASDVGMTANVLKLINSSYFGLPRHVASPTEAAIYLGMETISSLVISAQTFSQFNQADIHGLVIDDLVFHSMHTGKCAKALAARTGQAKTVVDHSLIAGLLHDCGKLVLAGNLIREYDRALSLAENENKTIAEAEQEVFHTTHAEVGGALLGIWGLPDPVIEAVALHHKPGKSPCNHLSPLTAVHVAECLGQSPGPENKWPVAKIDAAYISRLGLTRRIPEWRQICLN